MKLTAYFAKGTLMLNYETLFGSHLPVFSVSANSKTFSDCSSEKSNPLAHSIGPIANS
jgi:hypothetical protein